MREKIIEFLSVGLLTPIIYSLFSISIILATFIFGLPIGIGIYLIDLAVKSIFGGI